MEEMILPAVVWDQDSKSGGCINVIDYDYL